MSGVPGKAAREDGLDSPVELRPGRLWRKRGIPELPEALRATQGAGWGARLPPTVSRACLELVQGAEAEVRLLRQGRLALLAAARGSGRCSTESAFTGQPRAQEQRTPGRAQHPATPRRVSENDLSDPPCPLTMLAPWIAGRAAVPSSVLNLSLPRLFRHAREPDRRAEDALGDTRRLAPETEGKPSLTHRAARAPAPSPAPGCGGREPAPPPSDLSPARARGCCGAGSPPLAARGAAATPVRAHSLARSLTCNSSADPGRDEALERAPPACASSSSSEPRPPHPVSFQNQLPNWLAGMGRSGLCRLFLR